MTPTARATPADRATWRAISRARLRNALAGLAGVAVATVVVGLTEPGRRATPRVPDGYLVHRAPLFTLFAPSPESLRDGAAELSHAAVAFEHHFGIAPPPIDVVLTPPPGAGPAPDVRAMARPGVRILAFVTNAQLGATLRAQYAPKANADGYTRAKGGEPPPSVRFITVEAKTLAHEACHTFVAGYADVLEHRRWSLARLWHSRRGSYSYGHHVLPDWFDEMVATLCEGPASRARRRAVVGDPRSQLIGIRALLRMEHPLGEAQLARLLPELGGPAGRRNAPVVHVLAGPRVEAVLAATNAGPFYAESMLLGELIYARGGAEALRRMAGNLVAGHDMDATLHDVATAAPGVPSSVAALEAQWPSWLSNARKMTAGVAAR